MGASTRKFHKFRLVHNSLCAECGVRDDVEHALYHCPLGRSDQLNELERVRWVNVPKPELANSELFGAFVKRVLMARETRLRTGMG